jgi:hypothetical protein
MYDTLLQLDKIGQLTYEDIRTQDWTEHNELQKNKLSREALRMIRRSKAANKGSAETWNWKDRENALGVLRRFTKKVQGAGILPRVRSLRYNERQLSSYKTKMKTLKSIRRKTEIQELIKLGKMPEKTSRFSR